MSSQCLVEGLLAVETLMANSTGVAGLHLNGDIAPWDELRTGGRFEEWLEGLDDALEAAKDGNQPVTGTWLASWCKCSTLAMEVNDHCYFFIFYRTGDRRGQWWMFRKELVGASIKLCRVQTRRDVLDMLRILEVDPAVWPKEQSCQST